MSRTEISLNGDSFWLQQRGTFPNHHRTQLSDFYLVLPSFFFGGGGLLFDELMLCCYQNGRWHLLPAALSPIHRQTNPIMSRIDYGLPSFTEFFCGVFTMRLTCNAINMGDGIFFQQHWAQFIDTLIHFGAESILVLPSFTEFYLDWTQSLLFFKKGILLVYRVFPISTSATITPSWASFIPSFTEFYLVLPSFTEFYWSLPHSLCCA